MKKRSFYSILFYSILFFAVIPFVSCSGDDDDDDEPAKPTLALTDVKFDSTNLTLSAKTSLENGKVIKATCASNEHCEEAQVDGGAVSWNLTKAFPSNVLAGKEYKVTFSADGYNSTEESIWYYSAIKYTINCKDEILFFVDSIDSFELPKIKLVNYADADVTIEQSLKAQGSPIALDQFKALVKEKLENPPSSESDFNNGINAKFIFNIKPRNLSDPALLSKIYVSKEISITFKYQVEVKSVKAARYGESIEAICYAEETPLEADEDTAGGKLTYQWQVSSTGTDGWTDISGATSKFYELTSDSFGKYFRVAVTQTLGDTVSDTIYSASTEQISNYINTSKTKLYYNGTVLLGGNIDVSKISGTIINMYGEELPTSDFTIAAKTTDSLKKSDEYDFTLSKAGYETTDISIFVTVQNVITEDDLPGFSKDTNLITEGHIRFNILNYDMEYSKYNKGNWTPIDDEEVPAWEGLTIYFRYPAQGTPNTVGYIKESEALSLTVTQSDLGTKSASVEPEQIPLTEINFNSTDFSLSAKTTLPAGTRITVICSTNGYKGEALVEDGVISWNLGDAFPSTVLAGKQYKFTFRTPGYAIKEENIWYFAQIKYTINCESKILLFANSIDTFELPEIKLLNYAPEDVTIDTSLRAQGANLTLENFKELVKKELSNPPESESDFSNGLSAIFRYSITPKNVEDSDLRSSLTVFEEVGFTFKYQVLVGSVGINRYDEYLTAFCFADETAPDSDIETAGGKITYQWQWSPYGSENWLDIEGATTRDFLLTGSYNFSPLAGGLSPTSYSCYGKFFRVKIVQEWMAADGTYSAMPPVYSESTAQIVNYVNTSQSTLTYDGVVLKGEKVDKSKLKGEIIDINGNTLRPYDFIITPKYDEALNCSSKCVFTLSKIGYEDAEMTVFVTVQNVITESDIPAFDNIIDEIPAGYMKFADLSYDMEYSRYYKGNWKQVTFDNELVSAYDGLPIYFRYAAVGTPNTVGYIKESEALCRIVTKEYIGTKTSGSGIIDSIENTKLELAKKTDSKGNITITPIIRNEPMFEGSYTFDYMIDDMNYSASVYSDKNIRMSGNDLIIPAGALASDTYQIWCSATVTVNGQLIKALSAVYSLKIN